MNPIALASALAGLPSGKKAHARGPRPKSSKPGAVHLSALQTAHGKGDHHSAKLAALNYAKAITQHMTAAAPRMDAPTEGDVVDASVSAGPSALPSPVTSASVPTVPDARARLAKLAMMRRK